MGEVSKMNPLVFVNPITFFFGEMPGINLGHKIMEVVFILMGLICINVAVKNAKDKENSSPVGTAIFWGTLGIVLITSQFIPPLITGILIFVMAAPAILRRVKVGKTNAPSLDYTKGQFQKIGMKIFLPAFSAGIFAIIFAVLAHPRVMLINWWQAPLIGLSVGVVVAMIILRKFDAENKTSVFIGDSERFLSLIGPLCMLPMLLASLGAIFTAAGVGQVIANLVGPIIPYGNVNVAIIVFAISMVLFTMIMGNAFAAITVITIGIGYPFVLAFGANPVVIGMLALTCGYCGTLMTPMAANFNIVPVALLDMKSKFNAIKHQFYIAIPLLVFQIIFMIIFK